MSDDLKMNYCCDCEHAVRTGWLFKTWRCTNREVNKIFGGLGYARDLVTCKPLQLEAVECKKVRSSLCSEFDFPCQFYKGNLRSHPFVPPQKHPNPIPHLPPRTKKKGGA